MCPSCALGTLQALNVAADAEQKKELAHGDSSKGSSLESSVKSTAAQTAQLQVRTGVLIAYSPFYISWLKANPSVPQLFYQLDALVVGGCMQ